MQRRIATGAAVSLKRKLTGEEQEALAVVLASLYGLLGDRASFLAEEKRAFATVGFHGGENYILAAVHAKLGDMEGAVELLRAMVRHGEISLLWRRDFEMASVPLPNSEAFQDFLKEYEALEQRLRETY